VNILGIETSCDETAAAVVKDGHEVLSNVVYTQIPLHVPYGGVVPEIASRAHVEKIGEVVRTAMADHKIDAVAVTYGPGLSPALIVGLNAAKGLAKSLGVELIAINHIEAHLHTPFLDGGCAPEQAMPALGLAISGGHTTWVDIPEYGRYEVIGQTLDDAAGEAFDKAAINAFANVDKGVWVPSGTSDSGDIRANTGEFRLENKFYVLTASRYQELSWGNEANDPYYSYNYFTMWLTQGIGTTDAMPADGSMPADANNNGQTTLDELYRYVSDIGDEYPFKPASGGVYYQHVQVYPTGSNFVLFCR
jgi:hypothetical protein